MIERQGLFCALYSDRGSHFWLTPKAGEAVDRERVTQVGRALRGTGHPHDSGLLAAGARTQRAEFRHLAGTAAARVALTRRSPRWRRRIVFCGSEYIAEFNGRFRVKAGAGGQRLSACRQRDLERIFSLQFERTVNRDNTVSFQNLVFADSAGALESDAGGLHGRPCTSIWMERSASAMGRIAWGATRPRADPGSAANAKRLWRSRAVEKSQSRLSHRAWKSRTQRGIPTSPQPRRRATNLNRTSHLLQKPDIFTCYEQPHSIERRRRQISPQALQAQHLKPKRGETPRNERGRSSVREFRTGIVFRGKV